MNNTVKELLNKANGNKKFDFTQFEGAKYTSLKDLYEENGSEKVYTIKALYINTKGKYGDSPVALINGYNVNLPNHLLDTIKLFIDSTDMVDAINNNEVGFTIYKYTDNKYGKECYSVTWVDSVNRAEL